MSCRVSVYDNTKSDSRKDNVTKKITSFEEEYLRVDQKARMEHLSQTLL